MNLVRVYGLAGVEVGLAEEYDNYARFDVPETMVLVSVERTNHTRVYLNPPVRCRAGDRVEFTFNESGCQAT